MPSNHSHPYSQSSTSGDSMTMMQDEVVYRERNMYNGQGRRPRALSTTGAEGNLGNNFRLLPSQNTQASATSPGTLYHPTQSSLHGNPPSLPRHERKRRVRAIEEADRAEADHSGASPLDGDVSPLMARGSSSASRSPLPSAASYRSLSGSANNPFAMLEALVAQQQHGHEQVSRENDEERENGVRSLGYDEEKEADDLHGLRGSSKERAARPDPQERPRLYGGDPSSTTKRKAPPGGYGEANTRTARRKEENDDDNDSDRDFPNGEVGPVDASQSGATSRESSAHWNKADDRRHRGEDSDSNNAAEHPQHDCRPEVHRPMRRSQLSDHTNSGPARGTSVQQGRRVPQPPPQPTMRGFLDHPHATSILEHSRRHLFKATRLASNKAPEANAAGLTSTSFSKPKAVVRASSRSIVGSRPTHWGAASRGGKGTANMAAKPNPVSSLLSFNKAQKSKLADVLDRRPRSAIAAAAATTQPRPPAETTIRRAQGPLGPSPAPDPPPEARTEQDPNTSSFLLAPVSFVPSFLAKTTPYVSATKDETNDVEDADDVVPVDFADGTSQGPAASLAGRNSPHPTAMGPHNGFDRWERPLSPFPASPMPASRRRNNARDKGGNASAGGFLVRRLKALRDATKADTIRLQSYGLGAGADRHLVSAAPSSYFVMNDPRSKADSYMDLTLVGEECWACDPQHEKITYLAYCHNRHVRSVARNLPAKSIADLDPSVPSTVARASSCSNKFLLLCVTFATARERDLPSTRNLRVYSPIVVSVVPGGDETNFAASIMEKPAGMVIKHVVLATYLCEPYPDGLPALPEPPTPSTTAQQESGGIVPS